MCKIVWNDTSWRRAAQTASHKIMLNMLNEGLSVSSTMRKRWIACKILCKTNYGLHVQVWFVQLKSQRSQLSHTFRNFRSADTACGTTWEASMNEYISRKGKDGDWRGDKLKWQQDKKCGNKERKKRLTSLSCSTVVGTHPGHPLNRVTGLWPIEHWQLIQ